MPESKAITFGAASDAVGTAAAAAAAGPPILTPTASPGNLGR